MHKRFHAIALTGKPNDPGSVETICRIAEHLVARGAEVAVDADIVPADQAAGLPRLSAPELLDGRQLVICVGGDGTLLNTARMVVERDIPILGVNRGRLGFLVDFPPTNLSELDPVLAGQFIEEERTLLCAEVRDGSTVVARSVAFNDVVLYKWNTARMIEFTAYIDGQLLTSFRADGFIMSTPTGSTAYAMASGGPIMHPAVNAILLMPVCPHTLSNRPLVVGAESRIEIEVHPDSVERIGVSCDGQPDLGLRRGARLLVYQHTKRVRLIHPAQYRYFDILRAKLRWGGTNLR